MSVREAAERLDVSERRVLQLIAAGVISAERFGAAWMVSGEDVARVQGHRRPSGRPLGPKRAWAILDLLEGGAAPWLSASARSQLRGSLDRFAGADADRWRAALQGRSEVLRCVAHRAAVERLTAHEELLLAGPAVAVRRGFDLVASEDGMSEVYARTDQWSRIAESLAIRPATNASANLVVRLPHRVWPFDGASQVSDAALAADLLESPEPRAVAAAVDKLNDMFDGLMRAERR